jgi:D-glycero-alpha-D-manno-heptose-7-phosphate kinase
MIIARAPHRIPLGGGGTDLPAYYSQHGGFLLAAGINKYVYVYVNHPAADDLIRVKYSDYEEVSTTAEIKHDLIRPTLDLLGIEKGIEIVTMSDIPSGTGMGSSGSFLVASLTALLESQRKRTPPQALAELACHIEMDLAGHPVGKQDQYMAAFGGLTKFEIALDGQAVVSPINIKAETSEELQSRLLLFYTGMTRSASAVLQEQTDAIENGRQSAVDGLHQTKELGRRILEALESDDIDGFGRMLDEHWRVKKQRASSVTDPAIDNWYKIAQAAGSTGGKIVGAGSGGFLLLYSPPEYKSQIRTAMKEAGLREMSFQFDFDGAKVLANV